MLLLYNTLVFGMYVIREREEVLFGLFIEKKMVDIDLIAAPAFLRMRRRRRKNELKFEFLSFFSEPTKRRLLSFACLVKNEQKMAVQLLFVHSKV